MGAIQAQEYEMAKRAIGIRLRSSSLEKVNEALYKGDILRTHVMRPTWHFVAAEDTLDAYAIFRAYQGCRYVVRQGTFREDRKNAVHKMPRSDRKDIGRIQKPDQTRSNGGIAKIRDFAHHRSRKPFPYMGEVEGIVCSGIDKGKKTTYALLDERVPPTRELCREEALARLASRYFQSHSPAQLQDFVWCGPLTATECRLAINLIKAELMTETFDSREYFIHQSWKGKMRANLYCVSSRLR